jgi:hypothetical protein
MRGGDPCALRFDAGDESAAAIASTSIRKSGRATPGTKIRVLAGSTA